MGYAKIALVAIEFSTELISSRSIEVKQYAWRQVRQFAFGDWLRKSPWFGSFCPTRRLRAWCRVFDRSATSTASVRTPQPLCPYATGNREKSDDDRLRLLGHAFNPICGETELVPAAAGVPELDWIGIDRLGHLLLVPQPDHD